MKWHYIITAAALTAVLLYRTDVKKAERAVFADTITYYDTVRVEIPVPKDSLIIRYVTETLPVRNDKKVEESDNSTDSVDVILPITQKIYSNGRYKAYVSGYHPSLDSLFIYSPVKEITIKEKPKRWGIGPYVGVDAFGRGVSVGVSLHYSIVRF